MKSISPFQVPRQYDLDNQTATSIESHFKVIETITDYQESKAFRARLSGAISSFWSLEANNSALDSAKVNSKDIFGYYSLLFTKSRVVVSSSTLCNLPLTKDAERAIRDGRFRESYGDMIVVGFITGGEAEAVMRVTNFKEERRDSIRKALRVALQDNSSSGSSSSTAEAVINAAATVAVAAAGSSVAPAGGAAEYGRGQDDTQALQDVTTTLLSRRTGVTHQDQLHNPNNFPQLLYQLTKAAQNTGVKISALCYRVELFSQVPDDVLGFARAVVDDNVNTLQKQFAQVQFVYNSCEAHLAPGAAAATPDSVLPEMRRLRHDACAAMQRFAHFKGYRDVGQLSANDSARTVGSQLVQRFEDVCEKMRVAEVRAAAAAAQLMARALQQAGRRPQGELQQAKDEDAVVMWQGGSGASSSSVLPSPVPWAGLLPPAASRPASQPALAASTAYRDGVLQGRLLAGRNFSCGKVLSVQPYVVIKLDGKAMTSPPVSGIKKSNATFFWHFDFQLEVGSKLLAEDAALVMEVYDKNTIMSDKYLGAVSVPLRLACGHAAQLGAGSLQALVADGDRSRPTWYPVEKVDSGKYKCRGELQVALKFSTDLFALQQLQQLQQQAPEQSPKSAAGEELTPQLMRPLTSNLRPLGAGAPPPQLPLPMQMQMLLQMQMPPTPYGSDGSCGNICTPASNASSSSGTTVVGYPAIPSLTATIDSSFCGAVAGGIPVWQPAAAGGGGPAQGSPGALAAPGPAAAPQPGSYPPILTTPCVSREKAAATADSYADDVQGEEQADEGSQGKACSLSPATGPEQGLGQGRIKGKAAGMDIADEVSCMATINALSSSQAAPPKKAAAEPQPNAETHWQQHKRARQAQRKLEAAQRKLEAAQRKQQEVQRKQQEAAQRKQEKEAAAPAKARRGRGFLGMLLRLTVTGAVLGSAGAAAVLVGRQRFGVDLVAESKRFAVQYGTIAGRTTAMWARDGGKAVQGWTGQLATRVRHWQQNRLQQRQQRIDRAVEAAAAAAAAPAPAPAPTAPVAGAGVVVA